MLDGTDYKTGMPFLLSGALGTVLPHTLCFISMREKKIVSQVRRTDSFENFPHGDSSRLLWQVYIPGEGAQSF